MTDITYTIVEHDGGWAYKVGDVFSETFRTHDAALHAAQRAAGEQRVAGDDTGISYEDDRGQWRDELSAGDDRPVTHVVDGKKKDSRARRGHALAACPQGSHGVRRLGTRRKGMSPVVRLSLGYRR
jgi:hypothetical protein